MPKDYLMLGVLVLPNSPYYWYRGYNKYAEDKRDKWFKINTKIPVTEIDKRRRVERSLGKEIQYQGTPELKEKIRVYKAGRADMEYAVKSNVKVRRHIKLSQGFNEFKAHKTKPGDASSVKDKTIRSYQYAIDRFTRAVGDKLLEQYTDKDMDRLNLIMEEDSLSRFTRHDITNQLHIIFNFFITQNYLHSNIIRIYPKAKRTMPEDIPLDEFRIILEYFKAWPERYEFIYYLLLSMNRPSSALAQERSKFDFKRKLILMPNVKSSRKEAPEYPFPLFYELEQLVKKIMRRPIADGTDRLFSHFIPGIKTSNDNMKWFRYGIKKLLDKGLITKAYTMKQIRKTFPSFAYNELNMSIEEIKLLLDHADKEITEAFYLSKKFEVLREKFDGKRIIAHVAPGKDEMDLPLNKDEKARLNKARLLASPAKPSAITRQSLVKYKRKGLTNIAIGEIYKVSEAAIRKHLKKYNIPS